MHLSDRIRQFLARSILVLVGIFLAILMFRPGPTNATSNFNYSIDINYTVDQSGITKVREVYSVTNNTANQYLDTMKVSAPTASLQDLSVYYANGGNIPHSTEKITSDDIGYKYEYSRININFSQANAGKGVSWKFVVEYQTPDLVENKGRAHVVYIPGISSENYSNYHVTLSVPKDFGPMHGLGKLPKEIEANGATKVYNFSPSDLMDSSLQLLFGDSATYQANFNYPLENKSGFPKVYKVTLPPTTANQTVYLNKLEPRPDNVHLDDDNNIIATYTVQPNQKITVATEIVADVRYINYDLARSGQLGEIPANLRSKYTKATRYWNSDNSLIRQKTQEITKDKKNVAEMVRAINDYVVDTLNYNNEKIKYNIRQGSLEVFKNPSNAVCLEYSDLTIAMLRSAGIPARMPVGYGYSGNLKQSATVSDSLHSWVEAYIPNVGWINLDPTWGEKFNNFGSSDVDHFAFAIWGESDFEPVAITEADLDINYQYEDTTLGYIRARSTVTNDARLESSKIVILPFMSLIFYNGVAPSNTATFDLKYVAQNTRGVVTALVGALAPGQRFWGITTDLSPSFASPAIAQLVQPNVDTVFAHTKVSVVYWPIIIIGAGVATLIIWKMLKLHRKQQVKHRAKEPEFHSEAKVKTPRE